MPIHEKLAADVQEVDVIIAGGGTAACIVASRLAQKDPKLSILLVEGGQSNYQNDNVVNPALYLEHLLPTSKTAIFYEGNQSEALNGRKPIVPCGGILGGGSSINFMMYTRAQGCDFDSWNTPGWTAKDLWPYLNKLETYHGPGNPDDHGDSGPVNISDGGFRPKGPDADYMAAAAKLGLGSELQDLQNLEANDGYQQWLRYVSPDGKRQDTAHRYLHPLILDGKHPNLHVLVKSKVLRVLLDENKKAVGIEYTPNPAYQIEIGLTPHPKLQVKARKLVVVSAGACGSPSILERSGIGATSVLEKAGVKQLVDLPGVGHDYQDHNLVFYSYKTSLNKDQTLDGFLSGRLSREELLENKNGMLGWNAIDVCSKLRPTEAEVAALSPAFQAAWKKDFAGIPSKPLMLSGVVSCFLGDQSTIPAGQYVSAANYTAYPYCRGHIHITGPRLDDPLDFDVGFFTDKDDIDLEKQIWAYKRQREIMRRTSYYRGELAGGNPVFPEGSKAACHDWDDGNAPNNMQNFEYGKEDDAAIEKYLRDNINTTWHSLGTNKMAPREAKGVVDPELSVYGTTNLKVCDISIAPENVGANTNNTALVIGEKGSDLIAAFLGLKV